MLKLDRKNSPSSLQFIDLIKNFMLEKNMHEKQKLLSRLPSVDEILKSSHGTIWLKTYPRKYVLQAIRDFIESKRRSILQERTVENLEERMPAEIETTIKSLASYSLKPLINATGVVIHTNLGRSILSEKILENITTISAHYSNLEYDLGLGKRGKRYTHVKRILRDITGAEDALIVNNNAAAVMLCLNTLARGKEVIVSRGELVEIGGSFRMPDVMTSSGGILCEVGTTNKTHLYDYERAIHDNTAMILKIHKANFKVLGFTDEVSIEDLVSLGKKHGIPVMFDLGSGCLADLRPYGIHNEPVVRDVVKTGVDLTTFSGDKLLGGPQGGVIVGKRALIEQIQKNPITRAVRIDKLTLAGFEATLMEYIDEEKAIRSIPTLRMLVQQPHDLKKRAQRIAKKIKKHVPNARVQISADSSRAGGGALPEEDLPTYVIALHADNISAHELEERLRKGTPPVIARIKDDTLILDMRTIQDQDADELLEVIHHALSKESA